jgi:hypothetical protein
MKNGRRPARCVLDCHVCWLFAVVVAVHAIEILGPQRSGSFFGNVYRNEFRFDVRITEEDVGIPFSHLVTDESNSSVIHTLTITPGPLQVVFDKSLVGFVYENGLLTEVETCKVRNPALYTPNFTNNFTANEIAQLHFIGESGPLGPGQQRWVARYVNRVPSALGTRARRLLSILSSIGDFLFGRSGGGCDTCPTIEQFNALNTSMVNLANLAIQTFQTQVRRSILTRVRACVPCPSPRSPD